jgi:hypothetical protein
MNNELNIDVFFAIKPIVKVTCEKQNCKHHLKDKGLNHCNLKYITISCEGYCLEAETIEHQ